MSVFQVVIFFIFGFILGGLFVWFLRKSEINTIKKNNDELKSAFGNLSKEALDQNLSTFLKIAEDKFKDLVQKSDGSLEQKKELIDLSLNEMNKKLEGLDKSTAELKGQMENSHKGIGALAETTNRLSMILSSSQSRGQWGEKMVEDILDFMGLVEGLNYKKQSQIGEGRPDFTFFLPDKKSINMDVKFPLTHYENYLTVGSKNDKEIEKKSFLSDVRTHVKAIEKRSYIDPKGGTVDYVLMFIPNESIYSFLNQEDKDLIDFSLSRKVLLCSPITLYAVLSLIRQSVSSFSMEQKAGEMQKLIGVFRKQWGEYTAQMDKLGNTIDTVQNHYEKLVTTRKNQLDRPIAKIDEMQLGEKNDEQLLENNEI